jgi:hypothetical protein
MLFRNIQVIKETKIKFPEMKTIMYDIEKTLIMNKYSLHIQEKNISELAQ